MWFGASGLRLSSLGKSPGALVSSVVRPDLQWRGRLVQYLGVGSASRGRGLSNLVSWL